MIKSCIKYIIALSVVTGTSVAYSMATRKGAKYDDNAPTGILVGERLGLNADPELGAWHANLDTARAFAEEHGVPLVAVWSNGDNCGHCKKWENCAISDAFEEWRPESGIVFYFGYHDDPGKGATLGEWCYWCGKNSPMGKTLPLVRLYWKENGVVKVDQSADGDIVDGNYGRCTITSTTLRPDQPYYVPGDYDTYNPGGRYMIQYLKNAFRGYVPKKITSYAGGEFTAVDDEYAGLQVIPGVTARVNIPLWRTNETSIAQGATNLLWGVYPDGSSFTNEIVWAAGEKTYLHPIDITKNNRVTAGDVGKTIRLVLYDGEKEKIAESSIYIIPEDRYENSVGNPLWIGERAITNLISRVSADEAYDYVNTNSTVKLENYDKLASTTNSVEAWTNAVHKKISLLTSVDVTEDILNAMAGLILNVGPGNPASGEWRQDKVPASAGCYVITVDATATVATVSNEFVHVETNRTAVVSVTEDTFEYIRIDKPSLEYGEWTMDIDVVTNKVAYWNKTRSGGKRAYSLVCVSGSRWCPDCVMVERHFLDNAKFKAWAQNNNVALAVLDIPSDPTNPSGSPSLLTYYTKSVSDLYVSGRGTFSADETLRLQSGAPYISRKGIVMSGNGGVNASDIAKRNRNLISNNTLNGGWNRPERVNQTRTGVPSFILLRDDGTIAGRWDFFSDLGPSGWNDGYLLRLEELLAQDDENEESNQNWRTTKQTLLSRGESASATLGHTDLCDTYKIDAAAVGKLVSFRILGCTNEVQGTLKVIQASAGLEKTLASTTGLFSDEIEVSADIVSNNCYLVVSIDTISSSKPGSPLSPAVAATKMSSTVVSYSITSDCVLLPSESVRTETVSGIPQATISTVEGESYKITNIDDEKILEYFDLGAGDDIYIAKTTGASTLYLKDKDAGADTYTVSYQVWKTGQIGFEYSSISVSEGAEPFDYEIRVVRTGGSSGTARATLYLATNDVRCAWIRHLEELGQVETVFEWDSENSALSMEWGEGDTSTKVFKVKISANENRDGDQSLVFKLEKGVSDAGLSIGEFVLTVRDDEKTASPGLLAIDSTDPVCQKSGVLVASPGSEVTITVGRFFGTDGAVSGRLKTSAGCFSNGKDVIDCAWGTRDSSLVSTVLTLPAALSENETSVRVVLTADEGVAVDYSGKYLTIDMVSDDVCKFDIATTNITALRYVPVEKCVIGIEAVAEVDWSAVNVKKFSGSMPPGMNARFDETLKALVLEGIPTVSGDYEVAYRVTSSGVSGGAVLIRMEVQDPAISGGGVAGAMNPSIAVSRTFSDILVVSNGCNVLSGLMTLTVPRTGRLSGKIRMTDGSVMSVLSRSWAGFDADGTAVAELCDVLGDGSDAVFTFRALADGSVTLTPRGVLACYDFVMPASDGDPNFVPSKWAGYYTVNIPGLDHDASVLATGEAYAMLRMTDESSVLLSKMYYAGVLPDGTAFSGTAALSPDARTFDGSSGEYARAMLPVLSGGSRNSLSGVFSIEPYAAQRHTEDRRNVYSHDDVKFRWVHKESQEDISYEVFMDAFGGYYNASESLAKCCDETFSSLKLSFFALVDEITRAGDFALGAPLGWSTNDVSIGVRYTGDKGNEIAAWQPAPAFESNGLKFNFNPETGLVNGILRLDFENGSVNAQWRGLVMPGWGSGCGECQLGNTESVERPFISGSCWFTDIYRYVDGKGRQRTISVKRGIPFSVGVSPAQ